jgi:hypothetical protein
VGSFEALINLESNSTQTSTNVEPLAKKQHKIYDATRKWQDNCVAQFAWVDSKMVDNILVSIKCIVCDIIIGWVKCIMFKHDNLEKHMGKQQYIMTKIKNMFEILLYLTFDNLCLFYIELVMLLLGIIDTKLSSLPLFFMFGKWSTHGWIWICKTFIWIFEGKKFA